MPSWSITCGNDRFVGARHGVPLPVARTPGLVVRGSYAVMV
jgi:hypothetical protein